jgi:hypothetical protein
VGSNWALRLGSAWGDGENTLAQKRVEQGTAGQDSVSPKCLQELDGQNTVNEGHVCTLLLKSRRRGRLNRDSFLTNYYYPPQLHAMRAT